MPNPQDLTTLFQSVPGFYRLDILTKIDHTEEVYLQNAIFSALRTAIGENDIPAAKAIEKVYSYICKYGIAELLGLQDKLDSINLGSVYAAKPSTFTNLEQKVEQEESFKVQDVFNPTPVPPIESEGYPAVAKAIISACNELATPDKVRAGTNAKQVLAPFTMLSQDTRDALEESLIEEKDNFIDQPLGITLVRSEGKPLRSISPKYKDDYTVDPLELFSSVAKPTQVSREPRFKIELKPGYYIIKASGYFTQQDYAYGKKCVMLCFSDLVHFSCPLTTREMNTKLLVIAKNSNYTELGKRGLNLMYNSRNELIAQGYLTQIGTHQMYSLTHAGQAHLKELQKERFQDNLETTLDG